VGNCTCPSELLQLAALVQTRTSCHRSPARQEGSALGAMSTMMPKGQQSGATTYSFSSQPKPVTSGRKKYREPGEEDISMYRDLKETCITWDKRVHRGNTYSIYKQNDIKEALEDAAQSATTKPIRRRKVKEPSVFDMPMPERDKKPVDLTSHLTAKEVPIETETVEAQTDEFLPEPPPEHFVPQKTGIDVHTQVEDGEIFNFDFEVEPILDVLVNKTLEQSIMEVEEEHEIESMKSFKVDWYSRQDIMMKTWQIQVEEERVRWDETQAVMAQKREEKRREAQVLLKIQSIAAAKQHLEQVVPNAVKDLHEVAFPDMKVMAINRLFLPQLFERVHEELHARVEAEGIIQEVVADSVRADLAKQSAGLAAHRKLNAELERKRFEELQLRQGKMRVLVDDGAGGKVSVGPIQISSADDVEEVQSRVQAWMSQHEPKVAAAFPWGVLLCIEGVPIQATAEIFEAKAGQISMVPKPEPAPAPEEGGEGEEGEEGADEGGD